MHPFIFIGAVAGAFLIGRKVGEGKTKKVKIRIPGEFPIPTPFPELPPGRDVDVYIDVPDIDLPPIEGDFDIDPTTTVEARMRNAAQWAKTNYGVQIYPAGADKTRVYPPPSSGISATRDCAVVAVGERWWDRAAQIAKALRQSNSLTIANLERALFPRHCRGLGPNDGGMYALRTELLERAAAAFGPIRNKQLKKRRRRRGWI